MGDTLSKQIDVKCGDSAATVPFINFEKSQLAMALRRYNRHGHLCAPIRFQEVITTLGTADPRVAMRFQHSGVRLAQNCN